MGGGGARKPFEANQPNRYIAEDDGDRFGVFVGHEAHISALIVGDRFFKPILAVVDVAEIDFQSGQAPGIIEADKYLAGTLRGLKRLVILTDQDHRLNGTAQSPRCLVPIAKRFVELESLLMVRNGRAVIP